MRSLEIVLVVIALAATAVRLGAPREEPIVRAAALAAAAAGLAQAVLEGYRWQLVPAYGLVAALAVTAYLPSRAGRRRRQNAAWVAAVAVVGLLPMLLPIPRLPRPDGPHAVGTTTIVAVDHDRVEAYGPEPGGPRILAIHIWYPAEWSGEAPAAWLSRGEAGAVAHEFGLPGFFLDHLTLTRTHAVPDAPIAEGSERFPVVVYSHGWTGFGRISPDQPARLASHGYVVIAPDHTYGAMVADLPGGLVAYDPAALPDEEQVGRETYAAAARRLVATYAADLAFVIDLVSAGEQGGLPFTDRMDPGRIGLYGHSTGGGAAVALCHADPRCDAVLGLDPWVEPVGGAVRAEGLQQPFLALRSDPWVGEENDEDLLAIHRAGSAPSTVLAMVGAGHRDFVALSQISPLAGMLGFKGPIPGHVAQDLIGTALVSFFDEHLRGMPAGPVESDRLRVDAARG